MSLSFFAIPPSRRAALSICLAGVAWGLWWLPVRWLAGHGLAGDLVSVAVYALGGLWFWTMAGPVPDYLHTWLPGLFLTGVGVGMVLPALSGAAVAHLPPSRFGIGSAVNQAVRQVGAVMGVAVTVRSRLGARFT